MRGMVCVQRVYTSLHKYRGSVRTVRDGMPCVQCTANQQQQQQQQ
jgi:hypothetical protein